MIRIVDKLMMKELIPPFLFGVAAFTSLFFAGSFLSQLTNLLVQGVPIGVVGRLFILYLPGVVVLTLPMSVLLAVLLSFSRMSSDSEIVALWAGGVGLWRLMRSVALIALTASLLSYAISEWIAPGAHRVSNDLKAQALGEASLIQKPFLISDLQDGKYKSVVFVNGGMNPKNKELRNVTIFSGFTDTGPVAYFVAKRAKWEGGDNWRLYDGMVQTFGPSGTTRQMFREWSVKPVSLARTPVEIMEEQRDVDELTFGQLASRIRRIKKMNEDTRSLEVDLYNRLALPLASLVFALMAAPLGLRPHRGGASVGFGLSIGLIFAYWMVWHYTSAIARSGYISPVAGSFMADFIFLGVGAGLLARASK